MRAKGIPQIAKKKLISNGRTFFSLFTLFTNTLYPDQARLFIHTKKYPNQSVVNVSMPATIAPSVLRRSDIYSLESGIMRLTRQFIKTVVRIEHLLKVKNIGIFTSLTEYNPKKTDIKFAIPILTPMFTLDNDSFIGGIFMPISSKNQKALGFICLYVIISVQIKMLHMHWVKNKSKGL